MCGIVTIATSETARERISIERLNLLTKSLSHRGPDGARTWIAPDALVGMGHARLSVLDLENGWQPFIDDRSGCAVCFNGEIYNYRELKIELEELGRVFRTNSDTEVLLGAFLVWGMDCLNRLNGMFAFTLYDPRSQTLFFARDQFGVKPLYWSNDSGTLVIASELRSVAIYQANDPELSIQGLIQYANIGYSIAPTTLVAGVSQLPHGTYGFWKNGDIEIHKYFDLADAANNRGGRLIPFRDAVECVGELLRASVNSQLVSDVPIGAFLSGGVDSSLIASYANDSLDLPLKTWNLDFSNQEYSEAALARSVAAILKTQHSVALLSDSQILSSWRDHAWTSDAPIFDNSFLPTSVLCQKSREQLTVALSGDGADELFLGYETYRADVLAKHLRKVGLGNGSILANAEKIAPVNFGKVNASYKLRAFARGMSTNAARSHGKWREICTLTMLEKLLSPKFRRGLAEFDPSNLFEEILLKVPDADLLTQMSYIDCETWLPNNILIKTDRASMTHGLELRVPFLEVNLAKFAMGLPSETKFNLYQPKRLLKNLLKQRIPNYPVKSKKRGFNAPMSEWLAGPLLQDLIRLREPGCPIACAFDTTVIAQMIDDHVARKVDHGFILWSLMALNEWWRHLNEARSLFSQT